MTDIVHQLLWLSVLLCWTDSLSKLVYWIDMVLYGVDDDSTDTQPFSLYLCILKVKKKVKEILYLRFNIKVENKTSKLTFSKTL